LYLMRRWKALHSYYRKSCSGLRWTLWLLASCYAYLSQIFHMQAQYISTVISVLNPEAIGVDLWNISFHLHTFCWYRRMSLHNNLS
jgi:hypothetical protein